MRESKKETAAPRSLIPGISRRAFMASAGAAGLILRCDPLLAASGEDAAVQLGALEKAFQ